MRVLVTGGAAFIGSHIVEALVERGHEPRSTGQSWPGEPERRASGDAQVVRLGVGALRPRSLVCVANEPELSPRAELLQDGFTGFVPPLPHGELAYRHYPGGAGTLSEDTDGFSLMLADAALGDWCAVVPDTDGVARGQWEAPGE